MKTSSVVVVVGIAILIWGYAFVPLKHLTNSDYTDHPLSPGGFLVLRFVPLLPLLLLLAVRALRNERREMLKRDWPWILLMGLLVIPCYHIPMNLALRTPLHTGLTSLLLNLSPAMTYFLAVAFGQERAVKARTVGVVLAFAGLTAIFGEEVARDARESSEHIFSWEGTGWMLLCTISWTFYTLIGRRIALDHDTQFLFSASGAMGTLAVLAASPLLVGSRELEQFARLTSLDWASWAYVSFLSSFFAYWAWLVALGRYEASRLASCGNLVPLLVHAAAVAYMPKEHKAFTPLYLVGAAVTLCGTFLVVRSPGRA